MSALIESKLNSRYILITNNSQISSLFIDQPIQILQSKDLKQSQSIKCKVLAIDYSHFSENASWPKHDRLIIFIPNQQEHLDLSCMQNLHIHQFVSNSEFSIQNFYFQDEILSEDEQNESYLTLAQELNSEYEILKNDLEMKLNETRIDLMSSRQKIIDSNSRSESMRKILYAISMESETDLIENKLNELLPASSKATWIRIINQDQFAQFKIDLEQQLKSTFNYYKIAQRYLFFIKGDSKHFKKDDLQLFAKIKDVVEININREINYKQLILAEKILRTAFDKFNYPLAIINENYDVIQSNEAFNIYPAKNHSKCYELHFNLKKPCQGCKPGELFTLNDNGLNYEVNSRFIKSEASANNVNWIHIYKNTTEQKYFEKRLKQTVQIKELGIISSSIAHELNNPLGGIISYLQLIQMDLKSSQQDTNVLILQEINLMLETALRIKKIIEDLLIFSRIEQDKNKSELLLNELIKENLSLVELRLKNENIKIVNLTSDQQIRWSISKTLFRDSMHFIFNFFIERFRQYKKQSSQKTGLVEIKFSTDFFSQTHLANLALEFSCNCGHLADIEKSKDLSLLALSKLLADQKIILEIQQTKENWMSIIVIIPKS